MIEVREVALRDADRIARVTATGFHSPREEGDVAEVRKAMGDADRLGAWDGDELVGFAAALPLRLTVPGGELACAGVTAVGVLPTHRRRGILRQLIGGLQDQARARGELVAALWASEPAIYGRFGFGEVARGIDLHVETTRPLALRIAPQDAPLRLRTVDEALEELRPLHAELRARRAGRPARDEAWWRDRVFAPGWRDPGEHAERTAFGAVLLGAPGALDGYAIYRVAARTWGTRGGRATVQLRELEARTPEGEAALWRYLADLDLSEELEAPNRPADEPLLRMAADRDQVQVAGEHEASYLALLDVPGALAARAWAMEVDLVLGVEEEPAPLRLRVRGGEATCLPDPGATPDLTLAARDLAATYLGGTPATALLAASLLSERTPGAAAALDAALRTERLPLTQDHF